MKIMKRKKLKSYLTIQDIDNYVDRVKVDHMSLTDSQKALANAVDMRRKLDEEGKK